MSLNNPNVFEEILHNPHIMLCLQWEENLLSFEGYKVIDDIAKSKSGRPLIIISTGFDDQAATFLKSQEYNGVRVLALIAPGEDDFEKADIMNDIAECVGTLVIGKYLEAPPEGTGMFNCGEADMVKINQDWDGQNSFNLILGGKGASYSIEGRIDEIKDNLPDPESSYYDDEDESYYKKLMQRINNFSIEESNYKFKYVGDNKVMGNEPPS